MSTEIRRRGWIWCNGEPREILYVLGFDDEGKPYMHEMGTMQELQMIPVGSRNALLRHSLRRDLEKDSV